MLSYGFERTGSMWTVFAYTDIQRAYAIQSCFTRKQAKTLADKLNDSITTK